MVAFNWLNKRTDEAAASVTIQLRHVAYGLLATSWEQFVGPDDLVEPACEVLTRMQLLR